jgi:hypothetical protein
MAITANTSIPTPSGWVAAKDLSIGDMVFDHLGQPTTIKTIQHYTPQECYEIEFDDGLTVQGDKHLTLQLQDKKWRDRLGEYVNLKDRKMHRGMKRPLIRLTAENLHDTDLRHKDGRINYSVPNCLPVQYPTIDLPVPAYIFGVWFASLTPRGRMWLRDKPLNKMQRIFRNYGHFISTKKHKNGLTMFDIRPSVRDSFLFAGLDIPVSIPFYYLDSSSSQRMELLEGLIDGGFIKKYKDSNLYVAQNANYKLMRKIQGLVESLGIKTTLHTPNTTPSYALKFRMNPELPVVYGKNRRFCIKVQQIAPQNCIMIQTDTQYLVGEGYIPVC